MVFCNWNGNKKCLFSYIYYISSKHNNDNSIYIDGAAMKASQKWKIERILYLALIPISYWFVLFFINSHSDINSLNMLLSNMTNKILLLIFFVISMLHIRIQLGKVYEDYFKFYQMKTYSFLTDIVIGVSFLIFLPVLFF